MKWVAQAPDRKMRFEIEHQEGIGYYLYVFDNERCTHDYLQDTLEIAIMQAEEDFKVPSAAWIRAS